MRFKFFLCTVATLWFSGTAYAQHFQKLELKEFQKQWEEGKLTVADFRAQPVLNKDQQSAFSYEIGYIPEKLKKEDTTIFRMHVYSFMNRNNSWFRADGNANLILQYNQALFNLVEIYERRVQLELNRLADQAEAERTSNQLFNELHDEVAQYTDRTQNGLNAVAVQQFYEYTEKQLEQYKTEILPPLRESKFSYAAHGGGGYSLCTGGISDNFQNPINLVLGFDLGYKKVALLLNGALGFTEVDHAFTDAQNRNWANHLHSRMARLEASLGYDFVNTAKVRLQPFAGWSVVELAANDNIEVYKDYRLVDHTFSAGLAFDYKLRHRINIVPSFFNIREKTETTIRARLTYSPVSYNGIPKSNVISLSTEINIAGRLMKLK